MFGMRYFMEKFSNKTRLTEKIRMLTEKIMFVAAGGVLIFYLAAVLLFITGIGIKKDAYGTLIGYSVLSAIVTIIAKSLFDEQGIREASKLPENKAVSDHYKKLLNKRIVKEKKLKTIGKIMLKRRINDILFKGIGLAVSMSGMLYIAIDGSGQWGLIAPTLGTICLTIALGMKGYVDSYDEYCNDHIPALKEKIDRMMADEKK